MTAEQSRDALVEQLATALMVSRHGVCQVTDWAERERNPAVAVVYCAARATLPIIDREIAATWEAAAKVAEERVANASDWDSSYWDQCATNIAAAIRAKGKSHE